MLWQLIRMAKGNGLTSEKRADSESSPQPSERTGLQTRHHLAER